MKNIPIRIMSFSFDIDEVRKTVPYFFRFYGFSMTLPYLEPYLIRTMRSSLEKTTDPAVEHEARQFIGQEAQHNKQHALLNKFVRELNPAMEGIKKIEEEMKADYLYFTKTKSLKFNLAYVEGFEAAACAIARTEMEYNSLENVAQLVDSEPLRLLRWHLLEEVEHRAVTFNIYKHLYNDYFYRLAIGTYGQYHFFKYVFKFSKYIKNNHLNGNIENRNDSSLEAPPPNWKQAFSLLGKLLNTYMPWYNPEHIKLPSKFENRGVEFSNSAIEIRVPDQMGKDA